MPSSGSATTAARYRVEALGRASELPDRFGITHMVVANSPEPCPDPVAGCYDQETAERVCRLLNEDSVCKCPTPILGTDGKMHCYACGKTTRAA